MTVAQRDLPSAERLYRRWRDGVAWFGENAVGGDKEKDKARGCAFVTRECLVGPSTIAFCGRPVDCGLQINEICKC